jgi:hypothetical protein
MLGDYVGGGSREGRESKGEEMMWASGGWE